MQLRRRSGEPASPDPGELRPALMGESRWWMTMSSRSPSLRKMVTVGLLATLADLAATETANSDGLTIAVGLLALCIGFGFWWIYFDLVGRRLPRDGPALTNWVLSHFPITLSIAAAGAAIASLIGHAHDARAPAETAWLLGGDRKSTRLNSSHSSISYAV